MNLFDDVPQFDGALCAQADPDLWYPEVQSGRAQAARAKAICRRCPALAECLQWALDHDERWGIWGGTTELERRHIRVANGAVSAAKPINHGTPGGYRTHLRRKQKPCPACAGASSRYKAAWRERAATP